MIYHLLQLLYVSMYGQMTFSASPYIFPNALQAAYIQYPARLTDMQHMVYAQCLHVVKTVNNVNTNWRFPGN